MLYFSVSLITYLCSTFFFMRMLWVGAALQALYGIALACVVGWAFSLSQGGCFNDRGGFNPFYYVIVMLYAQRGEQGDAVAGEGAAAQRSRRRRAHRERREHEVEDGEEERGDEQRPQHQQPVQPARAGRGGSIERNVDRESAGRRVLRSQNEAMRASLLEHDYLVQPNALSPLSPAVSAFTPPSRPSGLPLWRPGKPVPPVPVDPKDWLISREEEEAPILILENPDGSVVVGHYVSDVPRTPTIPNEALAYFPDDLVNMLHEATEDDDDGEQDEGKADEAGDRSRQRSEAVREEDDEAHHEDVDDVDAAAAAPYELPRAVDSQGESQGESRGLGCLQS